jgi:hypothetical protein
MRAAHDVDGVWHCERCGGLISLEPIPFETARRLVNLAEMQDRCAAPQYFDLLIEPHPSQVTHRAPWRTHGWFDPQTKKVMQCGEWIHAGEWASAV